VTSLLRALLVIVPVLLSTGTALAQLEPGKRLKGHADLDCQKCHTEGDGVSGQKCLSCHEHRPLGTRIKTGKGLHATSKFTSQSCESCHLEHKGASYDPIDWKPVGGVKSFDHGLTGYDLEGAHKRVDCKDCHTAKFKQSSRTKYLGLDSNCLSCHEDVHRFRKSHEELLECRICHSFDARTVVRARGLKFDHEKAADFPLHGKHDDTNCVNCHTSTKSFKLRERPDKCVDCHKDVHKNVYTISSRDCKACHTDRQTEFTSKIPNWNHGEKTRFALTGEHKKQECVKCHTKTAKTPPKMTCAGCHQETSAHVVAGRDRFDGRDCSQCHDATKFTANVSFEHQKNTGFALGGKHGAVKCNTCHRVKPKEQAKKAEETFEFFPSSSCVGCHAHTDEHNGKFNDRPKLCVKCHIPGSTNIKKPNHRELTPAFAQQGAHAPIACDKCHGEALSNLSPGNDCASCHAKDDKHKGNLGTTCKQCHLEGYPWSEVLFTHNSHSDFKLEGKHQVVACTKCHTAAPVTYKPTKTACIDCHQSQDVHQAKLGTDCAKCHDAHGTTQKFDHNTMTEYVLDGAHARADCVGCHASGEPQAATLDYGFAAKGLECRDCHGDPHGLRPGASCVGCHTTESFKAASENIGAGDTDAAAPPVDATKKDAAQKKKNGDTPTTDDATKKPDEASPDVKGQKPSASTTTDAGMPDPDGGALEQAIFTGTQHTAAAADDAAVARVSFLVGPKRDRYHDNPPFALRDGHAGVDCARCHGGRGDMQGMGKLCDTCHRQDDIHAGSLGPTCADCHSLRAFAPSSFAHTQTGFTLVGPHRMISCKQCHGAGNYMGLSSDCVSCHLDDAVRAGVTTAGGQVHTTFIAQPCVNCHNQTSWLISPFLRRRL
jgi:hypothetical protein